MQRILNRTQELQKLRRRYAARGKEAKSRLLDEFCEHYGYERKYAIKLLCHRLPPAQAQSPPGPLPRYEPILEVVSTIWRAAEQLCGKRLAPALALWLPHYPRQYGKLLPT